MNGRNTVLFMAMMMLALALIAASPREFRIDEPHGPSSPSASLTITVPVRIDGNDQLDAFCAGNGTSGNSTSPHVIQDIWFDAISHFEGFTMINTDRYVIIKNCTFGDKIPSYYRHVQLTNVSNVMVENCTFWYYGFVEQVIIYDANNTCIKNATFGYNYQAPAQVSIINSTATLILDSTFQSAKISISISNSTSVDILNNTAFDTGCFCMLMEDVFNATGKNNTMIHGNSLLRYHSIDSTIYTHDFSEYNTVEGMPILFLKNQQGANISAAFVQVFLVNCSGAVIQDHHANASSPEACGIYAFHADDVTVRNISTCNSASTWAWKNSTNITVENCSIANSFNGYNTVIGCENFTITNSFYNRSLGWEIVESSNITLENCTAVDLMGYWWVEMENVHDAIIQGSNYNLVSNGILIEEGTNITISSNEFTNGSIFCSIEGHPSNIHVNNNTLLDSGAFITFEDLDDTCLTYNFTGGNSVDGKPVLHVKDQQDKTYTMDAFQVFVFNSTNITLQNMNFSNALYPGFLYNAVGLHVNGCIFANITSDVFRMTKVNSTTIENSTFSSTGGICNAFQCNEIELHNVTIVNQRSNTLLVNCSQINITASNFMESWFIRAENVSEMIMSGNQFVSSGAFLFYLDPRIMVSHAQHVTFSNNTVAVYRYGYVEIDFSSQVIVDGNVFTEVNGFMYVSFSLYKDSNITWTNNRFLNGADIYASFSYCTSIASRNTTVVNSFIRYYMNNVSHACIMQDTTIGGSTSFEITRGLNVTVTGCTFESMAASTYYIFKLDEVDGFTLKGCTFSHSQRTVITSEYWWYDVPEPVKGESVFIEDNVFFNVSMVISAYYFRNCMLKNNSIVKCNQGISISRSQELSLVDNHFANITSTVVMVYECSGIFLERCIFDCTEAGRCISFQETSNGTVDGCTFQDCRISLSGWSMYAIELQYSANITFKSNRFSRVDAGVFLYQSSRNAFENNSFLDIGNNAIWASRSLKNNMTGNTFGGNASGLAYGIYLAVCRSWMLSNNTFTGLNKSIVLYESDSNGIENCTFVNSTSGVNLEYSKRNLITRCTFRSLSRDGVNLKQSTHNNVTYCNFESVFRCVVEDAESINNQFIGNVNCGYTGNMAPFPPEIVALIIVLLSCAIGMPAFFGTYTIISKKRTITFLRKYKHAPVASNVIVKLDKISKEYKFGKGAIHALQDVSLEIEKGDFVSIMGPSGSGKSTMLNIIGTLDAPTSGDMLLAGKLIFSSNRPPAAKKRGKPWLQSKKRMKKKEEKSVKVLHDSELATLRKLQVGFIFQSYNLIPVMTARENVMLPMTILDIPDEKKREKATALLESVGLGDKAGRLPTQLSGGEQQRVAIARALANDPIIVLADEPTGNLDQATGRDIMKLFEKFNQEHKQTFVIVTHDPVVASRTHKIITIKDGSIQA